MDQIASDGAGGVIIVWVKGEGSIFNPIEKIYAQHIDSNGNVLWQDDVPIFTFINKFLDNLQIVSDGSGGAIITWLDYRSGEQNDIYAQNVNADGTLGGGVPG